MKKICTFIAVLMLTVLFVGTGNAQLFTEDFNYTGAVVGVGTWTNPGASTINPLSVSGTSGLSYTSGSPYAGSGVGGLVNMTNNGQDLVNTFAASGTLTTGSVYFSAMINVSAAQASGDYFINFGDGTSSIFFGKIHAKSIGGSGFEFGISKQKNSSVTDATAPLWTAANYGYNVTHFVVLKYTFVAGTGLDEIRLYVDPAIGGTEAGATVTLGPTTDNGNTNQASLTTGIRSIDLRQGTASVAPTLQVDGIRIGITWASVTPAGGASPTLLATPGNITDLWYLASGGGPSASKGYTLSGTNLTGSGNILVTAPAHFQVSTDSSTGFGSTANVAYTGPTLTGTRVYVRLASGLSLGNYGPSNVTNAGGGVVEMDVPVSGSSAVQTLTVTPYAPVALGYVVGGTSGASDYSLSGQYLTPATGSISITAPANFEISLDNVTFSTTPLSVSYGSVTAGVLATTPVYVRLVSGKSIGTYGPGNLVFAGGSASTVNISITGTVTAAGLQFSDDFSYTLSSTLAGQGGWVAHNAAGTNPQTIVAGLSYTGLAGSGVGNAVSLPAGSGEDCNHQFTNINSGSVYASAMINVVSGSGTDYVLHFGDAGTMNFCARVYIKTVTGGYNIGLAKSSGVIAYAPGLYTLGSTHLIVMKYNFVAGSSNDFADLYIDPTPGASEPGSADIITDNLLTDQTNISGIFLRQGSTSQVITVDGIKAGTTWASVTPSPKTFTLTALLEAMYVYGISHSLPGMSMTPDVTVELHDGSTLALVESKTATLSTAGVGTFTFTTASNGTPYYIVVKHINSVETWSATAQSFTAGALSYDFTTGVAKAYTDPDVGLPPLALHNSKYCIYSGDCTQNGFVTSADFTGVDNDGSSGDYHIVNDLDGNGFVTSNDFTFIDNNGSVGVARQVPVGAPSYLSAKRVIKTHVQQKSSGK